MNIQRFVENDYTIEMGIMKRIPVFGSTETHSLTWTALDVTTNNNQVTGTNHDRSSVVSSIVVA